MAIFQMSSFYGAHFVPKMQLQFSVLLSASRRQFHSQHMHSVFVLPSLNHQHSVLYLGCVCCLYPHWQS